MRVLAAFVCLFVFSVSCTKKDPNLISVDSPFLFSYDQSLSQGEIIAKVDGEEIGTSQLYGPSPALQELEERMNKIVLVLVYEKALAQLETGDGENDGTEKDGKKIDIKKTSATEKDGPKTADMQLVFGFAAPKEELKTLLGAKLNKNIAVTFDETAVKGQGATLGEKTWTREELAGQDMLLSRLLSDSFKQKVNILEGVVSRRKILQASKDANTPMEDYIQNTIMKGVPEPTEADLAAFAKNNNIYEADLTPEMKLQVLDTIKARERDLLMSQYVAKNMTKAPIKVGFKKAQLRMDGIQVSPEMVPSKGQGPIEVLIFSNTQCEACKALSQSISAFVDDNPKYFALKYIFNFPDSNNEERMLAEASLCVRKQSEAFFWQFPSMLKQGEASIEESINNAARATGADFEQFRTCFLAREFKTAVDAHLEGTKTLGFHKPPVAVLNGMVYENPNAELLIDQALSLKAEKGLGFNLLYKLKKMLGK